MKQYDIVYYPNFPETLYKVVATTDEYLVSFGPYNKTISPKDGFDCVIMRVRDTEFKNGEIYFNSTGEMIHENTSELRKLEK